MKELESKIAHIIDKHIKIEHQGSSKFTSIKHLTAAKKIVELINQERK